MRTMTLTLLLAIAICVAPMPSYAIYEPTFAVIEKLGEVEVRQYTPYVVAEVVLTGSAEETGNQAFRILAGYLFGKNKGAKQLAMGAPVTQAATPVKLAMTAPVTQSAMAGAYRVQFVLPKDVTLEQAPVPVDPRILLRQEPAKRVAVVRYSGWWSEANYNTHLDALKQALKSARVPWSGAPIHARYNPPFTPWFMRRNEIWLEIATPQGRQADG